MNWGLVSRQSGCHGLVGGLEGLRGTAQLRHKAGAQQTGTTETAAASTVPVVLFVCDQVRAYKLIAAVPQHIGQQFTEAHLKGAHQLVEPPHFDANRRLP